MTPTNNPTAWGGRVSWTCLAGASTKSDTCHYSATQWIFVALTMPPETIALLVMAFAGGGLSNG